jgi:transposase
MGHTRKRHYDQYSLAYKLNAILLASSPDVLAKDIAHSLGIHPIMLYRWCMEHRQGTLFAQPLMKNNHIDKPKKEQKSISPEKLELAKANARIKKLEKQLARREEDIEILKKFERFLKENQP